MSRAVAFLSMLLLFGCGQTAEQSVRTVFALPEDEAVDTTSVRRAALARFPEGTPEANVVDFLKEQGLSEGRAGAAYYLTTGSELVLRFDDARSGLVTESFGIRFVLDNQRRVTDVEVQRWLTGP